MINLLVSFFAIFSKSCSSCLSLYHFSLCSLRFLKISNSFSKRFCLFLLRIPPIYTYINLELFRAHLSLDYFSSFLTARHLLINLKHRCTHITLSMYKNCTRILASRLAPALKQKLRSKCRCLCCWFLHQTLRINQMCWP